MSFFRKLSLLCLVCLSLGFVGLNSIPALANTDTTRLQLQVVNSINPPPNPTLTINLSGFEINPALIEINGSLVFKLDKVTFNNGQTAVDIDCKLHLRSPDNQDIILAGKTNTAGECAYDTTKTLSSQNLTLVQGNLQKLNSVVGSGSGYGEIIYNNVSYNSDSKLYEVIASLTLVIADLKINPGEIFAGQDLAFSSGPIKFNNNQLATNVLAKLYITNGAGEKVVLQGYTNSQGVFVYTTSKSLNTQAVQAISGDYKSINNAVGQGQAYLEFSYNSINYKTNLASFKVKENLLSVVVRTGGVNMLGGLLVGVLLLGALPLLFGVREERRRVVKETIKLASEEDLK